MNAQYHIEQSRVQTGARPQNKDEALRLMAGLLASAPAAGNVTTSDLLQKMLAREDIGSTGFGGGIAIPHCATEGVDDFLVAILAVPAGVEFNSMDGKPVRLIVGIVAPAAHRNQHIHLLSAISSVLRQKDTVDQMVALDNADELRRIFASRVSGYKKPAEQRERNLVNIYLQHEDRFEEILAMLTEIPDSSISVFEADNVDRYLHSMPLFASFWSGSDRGFHRLVTALVDTSLTNELVRKINLIIEQDGEGIMVVVQSTVFVGGSLGL